LSKIFNRNAVKGRQRFAGGLQFCEKVRYSYQDHTKYTVVALKLINVTPNSSCNTVIQLKTEIAAAVENIIKECCLQQWKVTMLLSTKCVR